MRVYYNISVGKEILFLTAFEEGKFKMFFIFAHNNKKVFEGILKNYAFDISKIISDNPEDSFCLKIMEKSKRKSKIIKEMTNVVDISEYCLYSLL